MAPTRQQKEAQVKDLSTKLQNASSVIFAEYMGLSVGNITKLRANLRKENAEMQVAKKTLIGLALKETNGPAISPEELPGGIACIFSFAEPTTGPSIAYRFGKDHPHVKFVGGIFSGKKLTAAEAIALATIPSRKELLAIFLSMCRSPLVSFASMCSNPLSSFARGVAELAKQREASPSAPTPA